MSRRLLSYRLPRLKPFQFVILSTAYYTFQMLVYVDIDEKIIKKLAYDGTDS